MRKTSSNSRQVVLAAALAVAALLQAMPVKAASAPGTTIVNTAQIRYTVDGQSLTAQASHSITTSVSTQARIALFQFAPPSNSAAKTLQIANTQCLTQGNSVPKTLEVPTIAAAPGFTGAGAINALETNTFRSSDAVLVRIVDPDQNTDPLNPDVIEITVSSGSDKERLLLTETGPSTGEFAGYIQMNRATAIQGDCKISTLAGDKIVITYVDSKDGSKTEFVGLVDPFGRVFDSVTGASINGVRVTLIDNATGLPAKVFGDDGISVYPNTMITGSTVVDSNGNVYPHGAGQYRFPLIALGKYRIVVEPINGYRYPSALTSFPSNVGNPWIVFSASRGEVFDVPDGPPVVIDIPMDPRLGRIELSKISNQAVVGLGDTIVYALNVKNTELLSLSNIAIQDILPAGFRYRQGSVRFDGLATAEPSISANGQQLNFLLTSLKASQSARVTYAVQIAPSAPFGSATNTAIAFVPGSVSNRAQATVQVRDELMSTFAILTGTVWDGCEREKANPVAGVRVQMEDGRFVISDTQGRWHIERVTPGAHVVQIDTTTLPVGAVMRRCAIDTPRDDNTRSAINESNGRAAHAQTVDLRPGSLWRTDFYIALDPNAKAQEKLSNASSNAAMTIASGTSAIGIDEAWLNTAPTINAFAFPSKNYFPMVAAVGVAITHKPELRVVLLANGQVVSAFNFDGTKKRGDNQLSVSYWRGVSLKDGINRLTAQFIDDNAKIVDEKFHEVVFAGVPVRVELISKSSSLLADGHTPITVAVKMFDRDGNPARRGLVGTYELIGSFAAQSQTDSTRRDASSDVTGRALEYTIGEDGIASIQLQPSATSGELTLRFPTMVMSNRVGSIDPSTKIPTIRAWIKAIPRDWLVVGIAQGTWMHSALSNALQDSKDTAGASPSDSNGGRIALYAKGTVRGDTLLTIAYDSRNSIDTALRNPERTLAQAIKPDELYTVYGDTSVAQRDAVSSRKLYLKIEREQFYALFGDFTTGLTATELGRFNRSLNGFKTEYRGDTFQVHAFAALTGQRAVRDEIAMDATTGIFKLSERLIQPGSDQFVLQIRGPFPDNRIIEERILQRLIDYRIDYTSGEIILSTFARPITFGQNRITLVAQFETQPSAAQDWVTGARISTTQAFGSFGITSIHDGTVGKGGSLVSLDSTVQIAPDKTLKIEAGISDKRVLDNVTGLSSHQKAQAWLVDYEQRGDRLNVRAFARRSDEQFGLNQQSVQDLGLLRIGGQARFYITEQQSLSAEVNWSETLAVQKTQLAITDIRYESREVNSQWFVGLKHANSQSQSATNKSDALSFGFQYLPADTPWLLRSQADINLKSQGTNSEGDSLLPNRFSLAADYRLSDQATVTAEQQWLLAGTTKATLSRLGVRYTSPWGGQLNSTMGVGTASLGQSYPILGVGYNQRIQLNDNWSIDGGLSRQRSLTIDTLFKQKVGSEILDFDSYTAANLGASYTQGDWNSSAFIEGRRAPNSQRNNFGVSTFRKLDDGIAVSGAITLRNSDDGVGTGITRSRRTDVRFASASRPATSPWSILQRLDLSSQKNTGGSSSQDGYRILNNLHINYFNPQGQQLSVHHAIKWNNDTFDTQSFRGVTQFLSLEARADLLKWLDLGLHGFTAYSNNVKVQSSGYGISAGMSPNQNVKIVVGYNQRGLVDKIFPEANWANKGVFVRFQLRFDQDTLKLNKDAVPLR